MMVDHQRLVSPNEVWGQFLEKIMSPKTLSSLINHAYKHNLICLSVLKTSFGFFF